jgi:CRP-like cAMP-binding protein
MSAKVKECALELAAEPDNPALRVKLAAALAEAERLEEAVGEYTRAARAFLAKGAPAPAAAACRRALDLEPEDEAARALLDEAEAAAAPPLPRPPGPEITPAEPVDFEPIPDDSVPHEIDEEQRTSPAYSPRWRRGGGDDVATRAEKASGDLPSASAEWDRSPSMPPELERYRRDDRLLDVDWPEGPALEQAKPTSGEPTVASGKRPAPAPRAPVAPLPGPEEDVLDLARAFDMPFAAAVENIAPDGSAIEEPLAVLGALPIEAMRELERRMTIRRCGPGTVIVREGDPGEACYILQAGTVRILKQDPGGSAAHHEVARLGPGSLFGEFALLADRRRHATVQAVEPCVLFEIPRRLLRELAANYHGVGPALEQLYRARLLSTLISTAPFFRPLAAEERGALMSRFTPRRFVGGETIVQQGEAGGGLYLVVIGNVEITRKGDDGHVVVLATLGEGAYFGEMSLLRGGAASASVSALVPVELAQLAPKDFYAVLSEYPVLWDELKREAERRELANKAAMKGETNAV